MEIKREKIGKVLALILFFLVLSVAAASAAANTTTGQVSTTASAQTTYVGGTYPSYMYGQSVDVAQHCTEGQDFIIQVPPMACQPTIVRSDLLEEQDVPVFCNIMGIKINPLIDVPNIKDIRPMGAIASQYVSGIRFYPARAAVNSIPGNVPVGAPSSINNLGWVVVLLKRQPVEAKIPEKVDVNITARIQYDIQNSFGISEGDFVIPEMTEAEWKTVSERYSFWRGKGYVRAERISKDSASISIYDSTKKGERAVELKAGDTSDIIYLTGFYCAGGVKINLQKIDYPQRKAVLVVNGNERIVAEGMAIDEGSKCTVSSISGGVSASVDISCPDGKYPLTLIPRAASLFVDDRKENFTIGSKIKGNVYFGYAGTEGRTDFIVVFEADNSEGANAKINEIKNAVNLLYKKSESIDKLGVSGAKVIKEGKEEKLDGVKIKIDKLAVSLENAIYGTSPEDNFKKAMSSYKNVFDNYKDVVRSGTDEVYSYESLVKAAKLAGDIGKEADEVTLLRQVISSYPASKTAEQRQKLDSLIKNEQSSRSFFDKSTGKSYLVSLYDVQIPGKDDASASIMIDDDQKEVVIGSSLNTRWTVSKIDENCIYASGILTTESKQICKDKTELLSKTEATTLSPANQTQVKVISTKVRKEAYVKLMPSSKNGETISNFSISIGIEKRAIQLSPEQMKDHITKVTELSKMLDDWVKKLYSVVETGKKACLATQAYLAIKNLMSGEGAARREAMNGVTIGGQKYEGWTKICGEKVPAEYKNLDECYRNNAGKINALTTNIAKAKDETNTFMKQCADKSGNEMTACKGELLKEIYPNLKDGDALNRLSKEDKSMNDIRDEYFAKQMADKCKGSTDPLCAKTKTIGSAITPFEVIYTNQQKNNVDKFDGYVKSAENSATAAASSGIKPEVWQSAYKQVQTTTTVNVDTKNLLKAGDLNDGVLRTKLNSDTGKYSATPTTLSDGTQVFVLLEKQPDSKTFKEIEFYNPDGSKYTGSLKPIGNIVSPTDIVDHPFTTKPKVQFYQTGKKQCFAAVIPFKAKASKNGYYVKMQESYYAENGLPNTMDIYNVGPDGLIDASGGDDQQKYIQQPVSTISTLPQGEERQFLENALQAVRQAQTGCSQKTISILEESYDVGQAIASLPTSQCYDFMSPSDCSFMFNVCDPFMCPPSRCNLGGNYPVANVVQSGIIGSLMLCSHNSVLNKGDVIIPVCVSGLYAGLQNVNSVLKSYRDCLNESLTTGKTVGICDQIFSIYTCELIWREALPFVTTGIPAIFGAGKGGGEYANFAGNWQAFTGTIGYFTTQYEETAFEAFKLRSTAQVGTEICKMFASLNYPNIADLIDQMAKPESPHQFFGNFQEIPFTSATVPATSQYSVFYHLYAGEDTSISYNIYLMSPATVTGVYVAPVQPVDVGYLSKGKYYSNKKDFTAPAGYREMCVEINGKRECGIGSTGTNFALNELSDTYKANQVMQNISSASECISGTPGVIPVGTLNPGQLITDTISPSIEKQGIIRICSQENPGKSVDEKRYDRVGWCDKNGKVACWLDRTSVQNTIKDLGIEKEALGYSSSIVSQYLNDTGKWNKADTDKALSKAYKDLENANTVDACIDAAKAFNEIEQNSFYLEEKTRAALGSASAYDKKVRMEVYRKTGAVTTSKRARCEFLKLFENVGFSTVPKNVTIAIAAHESGWLNLADAGNYYFAIKTIAGWTGEKATFRTRDCFTISYCTQMKGEPCPTPDITCASPEICCSFIGEFRAYGSVQKAVTNFITVVSAYSTVKDKTFSNEEAWINAIAQGGYATDKAWASKAISNLEMVKQIFNEATDKDGKLNCSVFAVSEAVAAATTEETKTEVKAETKTETTAEGIIISGNYPAEPLTASFGLLKGTDKNDMQPVLQKIVEQTESGETLIADIYTLKEERDADSGIKDKRENAIRLTLPAVSKGKTINLEINQKDGARKIEIKKKCEITNLKWSDSSVEAGKEVRLYVQGKSCSNVSVEFEVYEDDVVSPMRDKVRSNPKSAFFDLKLKGVENIYQASSTWKAEFQDDGFFGGNPEYFFIVKVYGEVIKRNAIQEMLSGKLEVKEKITDYFYEAKDIITLEELADTFKIKKSLLGNYKDNAKVLISGKNYLFKGEKITIPLKDSQYAVLSSAAKKSLSQPEAAKTETIVKTSASTTTAAKTETSAAKSGVSEAERLPPLSVIFNTGEIENLISITNLQVLDSVDFTVNDKKYSAKILNIEEQTIGIGFYSGIFLIKSIPFKKDYPTEVDLDKDNSVDIIITAHDYNNKIYLDMEKFTGITSKCKSLILPYPSAHWSVEGDSTPVLSLTGSKTVILSVIVNKDCSSSKANVKLFRDNLPLNTLFKERSFVKLEGFDLYATVWSYTIPDEKASYYFEVYIDGKKEFTSNVLEVTKQQLSGVSSSAQGLVNKISNPAYNFKIESGEPNEAIVAFSIEAKESSAINSFNDLKAVVEAYQKKLNNKNINTDNFKTALNTYISEQKDFLDISPYKEQSDEAKRLLSLYK